MINRVFILFSAVWTYDVSYIHLCYLDCFRGNASINVKPEAGGTPGICGAFDFSEEFLVKIPTVGPQNLVKSDQISPGVRSIYIENG